MASAANLRDAAAQLCFASAHSSALSSSSTSHRQCPAAGNCTAGPRLCWKSCLTGNSLQFKSPCASRRRVHCRSTVQADLLAASADAAPILDLAASGFSGVNEFLGALSSGHFASPLTAFFGDLSDDANGLVELQLAALSPASLGVIFSAGIVTSLSPCTLSVLPLTLGYIGASASGKSRHEAILSSIAFCLGLATTLTGMGIAASLTGKALVSGSNQVGGPLSDIASTFGRGLPEAVSIVAVLMGLNLLQVFQLPSLKMGRLNTAELGSSGQGLPSSLQAYIAGLTFALVASPCTTPIRATLLSYVAASQDPVIGGSLLLVYTFGYIVPLLLAASFAGVLQEKVLSVRQISGWANTASGALLLGGGIYTFLMQLQSNPTYSTALADASSTMAVVHHCH